MTPFKSQSYPKMAKAILAAVVLAAAFGPSIMRSADKKTRSHITAVGGRVFSKSDTARQEESKEERIQRELEVEKREQAESKRLAEERRVNRLEKKLLAEQKAELKRLERKQRLAEEKMEKQMAEGKRRAEKELARQLAEEEFRVEKEVEQRIEEKLRASKRELEERLLAEEAAKAVEFEKKIAEERKLAVEALRDRLAKEEALATQEIQNRLYEKETVSQEKLELQLAAEEQIAKKKIEKQIADEAKAARKELAKRLDERERLAKSEMEKRVEQESLLARKELEQRIKEEGKAKKAHLIIKLEAEEQEALAAIEERLKEESLLLSERKRIENERSANELAEKSFKSSRKIFQKKPKNRISGTKVLNRTFKEDEYKRPSLWGSFRRVPKQLLASIGSISLPTKEPYPGYLAFHAPPPLRFSDDSSLEKSFSSAALPEFSMVSPGRGSLVVETELSEDAARKQELQNRIVVELEPHTIVSGKIDTTIPSELEERDRLLIEESQGSVVRPEEVLIFFENKREGGNARTIVPFSPAVPSQNPPSKSGATYNRK